jgi:hypothetical protein
VSYARPKKRVFLSFIAEDLDRVRGLRLLVASPNYDLEFYDESVRVPINSERAVYIKDVIRDKIRRSSVTVCLISEKTHTSSWVGWELEESQRQGKKIIAMALKGVTRAVLPKLMKEQELTFHPWDPTALAKLIAQV